MILYSSAPSYYSMIARLALLEANIKFTVRSMDIHFAKDQLSPWYLEINPAMTVPTLVDKELAYLNSRDILAFAASSAEPQWADATSEVAPQIKAVLDAHYAISIEHLTFVKAMKKVPPLQFIFPYMLRKMINKLEIHSPASTNFKAMQEKIALNHQRLAYFTESNLTDKLASLRENIENYIKQLPTPAPYLFGEKLSSADIVTCILFARLKLIDEYALIEAFPPLHAWFEQMQNRAAFKQADIWMSFRFSDMLSAYFKNLIKLKK